MSSSTDRLTLATFAPHVNSTFRITFIDSDVVLELLLMSATDKRPQAQKEAEGLDVDSGQFSLLFRGPLDPMLVQHLFVIEHEVLGTLHLFLVPVGKDEDSTYYESAFCSPLDEALLKWT